MERKITWDPATQTHLLSVLQNYDYTKKHYIVNKMYKLHFYFHSMYFSLNHHRLFLNVLKGPVTAHAILVSVF